MVTSPAVKHGDLKDAEWARLQPLLPPQRPKVGRPAKDHRRVVDGILWILRTGAPWRDLPEHYGKWKTVNSRFYRWRAAGIWEWILRALQEQADAAGRLDWDKHYVDGSVIRAHQHAAGAKGGLRKRRASAAARAASRRSSTFAPRVPAS
jgi:transposase